MLKLLIQSIKNILENMLLQKRILTSKLFELSEIDLKDIKNKKIADIYLTIKGFFIKLKINEEGENMKILVEKNGDYRTYINNLEEMNNDNSLKTIMILSCDENNYDIQSVNNEIQKINKNIIGGIFPQLIYKNTRLEKGSILIGFEKEFNIEIIKNLSDENIDLDDYLETVFDSEEFENKTLFVFVDGLSSRISSLNEAMFNNWGIKSNYIGGGAGSLSFIKKPCIYTNEGVLEDSAIIGLSNIKSGVGVAHGWKPITEPLKITEVEANKIITINWEPAFDVYKKTVEKISNKIINEDNFFDIAKGYPFGVIKMSNEMVVRDPISKDKNNIICVGEIPQNSFVYILEGNIDSLIEGAKKAKLIAENTFNENEKENKSYSTFFIDCISRVLFLENSFEKELNAVYDNNILFGALTLGEIANTGKNYLEFYNKTSVVAFLED